MFGLYRKLKDIATWHVDAFVKKVARDFPAGATVLDAGAGECRYKKYFGHCRYQALDTRVGDSTWDYSKIDVIAPLDDMPFEAASIDGVLCTEVLEHVEDPLRCLTEMHRVLKPDGKLCLTVPFFHHEHQTPYDFFRYTSFGLRALLNKAGFDQDRVVIQGFGGTFERWAYELTWLFDLFPGMRLRGGRRNRPRDLLLLPLRGFCLAAIRGLQALLLACDRLDKSSKAPLGWALTATKQAA
jgi:ubiquinone/menaquinone biosynthesis C-methylase UbiE